nr:GSCFA domain-containing protein [Bradyrhizobium sp. Oc8]
MALGSCFAGHFIEWLAKNGYEQPGGEPFLVLARNPFENIAVIAQQFRWAFGEADPGDLLWADKSKQRNYATEEKRLAMRQALMEADVFIATLSLSEIWYDRLTGEPLWRVMPPKWHDPERHAFKVMSFAENIEALETIERIRAQWLPKLKIIYTVSPQPLGATFRPVSAVTANAASKAIVRGALDEFFRSRGEDLNRIYFYFPGYELVTSMIGDPFLPDNRHIYDHVVDFVLDLFARTFTSNGTSATESADLLRWPPIADEQARLSELERRNAELQRVCDDRLAVIDELKRVCDERLALIEKLHGALHGSGR